MKCLEMQRTQVVALHEVLDQALPIRIPDFLRFEQKVLPTEEGSAVIVNVMTDGSGEERKLTTLIITLEQLRQVLKQYE